MARRSGGGGGGRSYGGRRRYSGASKSSSTAASRAAPAAASSPPPQKANQAQPPAPAPSRAPAPERGRNFASAIAEGYVWGAATSMGRRAMDSIFGPRTIRVETVDPPPAPASSTVSNIAGACITSMKDLFTCLNNYSTDISKCQFYMDSLTGSGCRIGGAARSSPHSTTMG